MLQRLMLLGGVVFLAACSQPASPALVDAVPAPSSASSSAPGTEPHTAPATALPLAFIAFGNEPFWTVRVDGQQLHWNSPDNMEGIDFTAQAEALDAQRRYHGQLDGQAVSLTLSDGPCSDGMSDQVHPWRVSWSIDGRVLEGCARAVD